MKAKAHRFRRRLSVYNFMLFLTILLSVDLADNCKKISLNKKKKKTKLCIKLMTVFLLKKGIQNRIERSAHIINKGSCIVSFKFSIE